MILYVVFIWQVYGVVNDIIDFVEDVIIIEMNSVIDNLVFLMWVVNLFLLNDFFFLKVNLIWKSLCMGIFKIIFFN